MGVLLSSCSTITFHFKRLKKLQNLRKPNNMLIDFVTVMVLDDRNSTVRMMRNIRGSDATGMWQKLCS